MRKPIRLLAVISAVTTIAASAAALTGGFSALADRYTADTYTEIDFDSIKAEHYWQGAPIDPIEDYDSDEYLDLKDSKGKLYNGTFYWKNREDVKDGLTLDVKMPEIKNGRYYYTEGNGYVEIKDHKSFRLVGFDDEMIEYLKMHYSKGGYGNYLYDHKGLSSEEKAKVKDRIYNSTQIEDLLINNYADFYVNPIAFIPEETGTNIEITTELSDYDMWFPFQYQYLEETPKLLFYAFDYDDHDRIFEYREN